MCTKGYEVEIAKSGADGLLVLRDHPRPDAIILDLMMPILRGDQFLQQLPANCPPVIISTGAYEEVPIKLPTEVKHVLLKGNFTVDDLFRAIDDVLPKRGV